VTDSQNISLLKASVLGASGYSGAELTGLLLTHPAVAVEHLYANAQSGKAVLDVYPKLDTDLVYETYAGDLSSDVYFLALPHGEALKLVPTLLGTGKMVIDLSGDFRLKNISDHKLFYKADKPASAVLPYGLPELFKSDITNAKAVSNPGCYATSLILGLAPLVAAGLVKSVSAVSLSGLSGAGKTANTELLFSEMSENVRAYKVGTHQHTPEVLQALNALNHSAFEFSFVPMVVPMVRGIYTTLNIQLSKTLEIEAARQLYLNFYTFAPFVRLQKNIPEVRHVTHTNFCDISVAHAAGQTLTVISTLDNLVKGAAGQAVQNLNLMLGLDERTGLLPQGRVGQPLTSILQ
jgi:N-acetyl-gamma-glutamyl-phosphate reductase